MHLQVLSDWQQRLREAITTATTLEQVEATLQQHAAISCNPVNYTPSQVVTAVHKLAQDADDARSTAAALHGAAEDLRMNPEGALQRVIRHFQELFDVPSLEGCIPTMSKARTPASVALPISVAATPCTLVARIEASRAVPNSAEHKLHVCDSRGPYAISDQGVFHRGAMSKRASCWRRSTQSTRQAAPSYTR
jgi:hypothetical protein